MGTKKFGLTFNCLHKSIKISMLELEKYIYLATEKELNL